LDVDRGMRTIKMPTLGGPREITHHKEIIEHLNKVTGSKFKPSTPSTVTLINSLFRAKFTLRDIKGVIDLKCKEWGDTDLEKYLRPQTLFNINKFDGYLQEFNKKPTNKAWTLFDKEWSQ